MCDFENKGNFENNINFLLEEKTNDDDEYNKEEINKQMDDLNEKIAEFYEIVNLEPQSFNTDDFDETDINYYIDKAAYGNDELYYDEEYNVKDLLKICAYYGIDKNVRTSKCKKPDIISTIVYFESQPDNFELVQKRNRMWAYITELMNDPKMKKYIIF
jgi:hypothetical protein